MRLIVFILSLLLAGCVNHAKNNIKEDSILHCPAFSLGSWSKTNISASQQIMFINKQEFAVPPDYQTLWFKSKSKSNSVGLCIIPDKQNRGSGYGCSSAYAIYAEESEGWQLKDQKVAICSS
jgi:hypothetical protein